MVINAVRAPFRSSTAFVATVEPCVMRSTDEQVSERRVVSPFSMASAGSRGVLSTFRIRMPPSSARAKSVKVPPMSTPTCTCEPPVPRESWGRFYHRVRCEQETRPGQHAGYVDRHAEAPSLGRMLRLDGLLTGLQRLSGRLQFASRWPALLSSCICRSATREGNAPCDRIQRPAVGYLRPSGTTQ